MKTVILACLFLSTGLLVANLDINEMEMMVKKIQEPRASNINRGLLKQDSPFEAVSNIKVTEKKIEEPTQPEAIVIIEESKTKIPLKVKGIVNKKVNINDNWLGKGDMIDGYRVIYISNDSVKVKKGNETRELSVSEVKRVIKYR